MRTPRARLDRCRSGRPASPDDYRGRAGPRAAHSMHPSRLVPVVLTSRSPVTEPAISQKADPGILYAASREARPLRSPPPSWENVKKSRGGHLKGGGDLKVRYTVHTVEEKSSVQCRRGLSQRRGVVSPAPQAQENFEDL